MKILLLGHGTHGKDTVAQMIADSTGMNFESSSLSAAKIFLYDVLKEKYSYTSFEECYNDRHNHRAEWHQLIADYNKEDGAKLAKGIIANNDMYVGMRSDVEFEECKKQGLFDMIIGVFDPNKPLESKASFNIDMFAHSDYIIITGDLEKVKSNVERFCKIFT